MMDDIIHQEAFNGPAWGPKACSRYFVMDVHGSVPVVHGVIDMIEVHEIDDLDAAVPEWDVVAADRFTHQIILKKKSKKRGLRSPRAPV